jgi:hypothetical protein
VDSAEDLVVEMAADSAGSVAEARGVGAQVEIFDETGLRLGTLGWDLT